MTAEPRAPRRPARRFGWTEMALVVGLAALALLVFSSARLVLVRHELAQRADATQSEIAALEDEHARLQQELDWSKSVAGVERLAREQLGWAKAGESAVVVARVLTPRPTPAPTPTPSAPGWRRLWGIIPIP